MANLLPFALLALKDFKEAHPDKTVILGGVGSKSVERLILQRCPWIDIVARGEGEISGPILVRSLKERAPLEEVPGISFQKNGEYVETPRPERVKDLDTLPPPAFERITVSDYEGYGMITSRGCPYPCTFCSVAPVWDLKSYSRSADNIVSEMKMLRQEHGVSMFLFQDEFFVSGKHRVMEFCQKLSASGLKIKWKAFGRINLTDQETMQAMADCGCCEIRYGIESGSDKILQQTRKGFSAADAMDVVSRAVRIFARTDCFYIWGFPFETMDDFNQSLFQMVTFRAMGARILPSLLCLLPQTQIYKEIEDPERLEFCPELFPEYMITGHEVLRGARCKTPEEHQRIFDFIRSAPEIFPGFFHYDLTNNVLPKLAMLQEFGFYRRDQKDVSEIDSCGAHSPEVRMAQPTELVTQAGGFRPEP
jgi:radical SAM superfamily enzyme YgiQ (UPF0313 family)